MKASLVVLGTHGRGALEKLLIGSTAERVLRLSPGPGPHRPREALTRRQPFGTSQRSLTAGWSQAIRHSSGSFASNVRVTM